MKSHRILNLSVPQALLCGEADVDPELSPVDEVSGEVAVGGAPRRMNPSTRDIVDVAVDHRQVVCLEQTFEN